MDNPNITVEEYTKLQAEKAQRCGWTFNWDMATYGLTKEMGQTLAYRMRMVYIRDEGQELFTSHAWRRLFEIRGTLLGGARHRMTWRQFILVLGLHTTDEMAQDSFESYWLGSERAIPDKRGLREYWTEISSDRDFLGPAPSYTFIRDPVRRLWNMLISYSISGRGRAPEKVTAIDLFYLRSCYQSLLLEEHGSRDGEHPIPVSTHRLVSRLTPKSLSSWHRPLASSLNFYDHVNLVTRRTIDQSDGGKLRDLNAKESWALLEDLTLYDNKSWNDLRDFAKPVKAIALSQDVPKNKITTPCAICSGPHDTQYCMENPEQSFVKYASLRTDRAGDFMVVDDISSIIDPRLSQVVLERPFIEVTNITHDLSEGVVKFTKKIMKLPIKCLHKIEQYNSLSSIENEYTKSVYLRNEEDKRRGVDYAMSKILGFYKKCLELGPEYVTGLDDEGKVT
nr:MAK10-like protein [Tanacetum cinerariifolium]